MHNQSKFICLLLAISIVSCKVNPKKEKVKEWSLQNFVKVDSLNPILNPSGKEQFICPVTKQQTAWNERNVLNPAAVVKDGKVYLLFRSQDNNMTSRIGLAISDDGVHFTKQPEPVFYPLEDSMKNMNGKVVWKIPVL